MSTFQQTVKAIARKFDKFTSRGGGIEMRPYQLEPARAIIDSILNNRGLTFVIVMSRQAGKDELLANLIAYLLNLFAHREKEIVVVNPTYKPQTIKALFRLENRLKRNLITRMFWTKRSDFMRLIGSAVVNFLSGDEAAQVVGGTASLALIVNEAQDITPAKYDKDFAPMVASTNATRIFTGTVWTSKTLLAREMRRALELEKLDGIKRLFIYDADYVGSIVPEYKAFVEGEVNKLGRQHPLVKTQYYCEEIDAVVGMFNAQRRALMLADCPAMDAPIPGHLYALSVDVGGQDEALMNLEVIGNTGRDYVTVDIVAIDISDLATLQKPRYRVVKRFAWQGENHVSIFGKLTSLISTWNTQYIVIDATGVGEGLWGMLFNKYMNRVIPVKFTQATKSEIGYAFIGMIETGRFKDCDPSEIVREQYDHCDSEILTGPAKTMRWGVKDGTRSITTGELIHDDYILADAMISQLDKLPWYENSPTTIIEQPDALEGMEYAY
jgi:hypothetical protein